MSAENSTKSDAAPENAEHQEQHPVVIAAEDELWEVPFVALRRAHYVAAENYWKKTAVWTPQRLLGVRIQTAASQRLVLHCYEWHCE